MKNFTGSKPKTVKHSNQKTVLRLFKHHEILSITEASKITGLSKTTVIKIFDYLLKQNIIISTGKGDSTASGGKKPELFELNSKYGYVLSIHILSSKLLLSIADTKANLIITRLAPIKEDESVDKLTDIIADFINEITLKPEYEKRHLLGISIAAQGVTDSINGEILTSSRFPSWKYKTPIIKILKEKTSEDFTFNIDNQIRYISLAEYMKGKAKNSGEFFVLKAGSDGVGSGIIINGKLYRGNNYLAGEIGHMRIDPYSTEKCHCGGRGCFETLVTYEKIINRAKIFYKAEDSSAETETLTASDIFYDSNHNHPAAMKVMDEFAQLYAVGISNGCMMIDPELIIITGGIVDAGDYFLEKLREYIAEISLNHMKKNYDIQYTSFYKNGSLIGGALFTIEKYFEKYFAADRQII